MTAWELSPPQTPLRAKWHLQTVWAHTECYLLTCIPTQGAGTSLAEDCPKIHMLQCVHLGQILKTKRFRSILSPDTKHHLQPTRSITQFPWDHPIWRKASESCSPEFRREDSNTSTAPLKTIADGKRLTEGVTGNRNIQLWEKWTDAAPRIKICPIC